MNYVLCLLQAYYFAGLFLIHTQKYDKAREYIDRAYKLNSHSKDVSYLHFDMPLQRQMCLASIHGRNVNLNIM